MTRSTTDAMASCSRSARFAAALCVLVLLPLPLRAQEEAADEADTWSAEIGFALNASGGTKNITVLASELKLTHLETSVYEGTFGARFRYGRTDGEDVAQNLRGNASIDFWPAARWSPFIFAAAESDPFKKLDARLDGGAGVKHTFWQDDWDEVSVSGALLYSYENLEVADSIDDDVTHAGRWSWRGRARKELGEGRRVEQVVFYQPVWDDPGDYLIESRSSGRWALNQILAFTTAFLYERNSTPAPDVEADNWSLEVGLTVATQW